ncbi:MAG: hypothetical protein PVJ89_11340, partial [Planctomycetota bacterium]
GATLPELLDQPLDRLLGTLEGLNLDGRQRAVLAALLPELRERTVAMEALGLGHLQLSRRSPTLSAGELQRTRLASVLRSGLSGVTLVLDEPTSGLHARDVDGLLVHLRRFVERGNTAVLVEHEPRVLRAADHLIELGPGAGERGGEVVAAGSAEDVLAGDGPTAAALAGGAGAGAPSEAPPPLVWALEGCHANHLRSIDVPLPGAGLVAVTGVSGSGKSSLLFEVLEPTVGEGRPVRCRAARALDGGAPPVFSAVRSSRRATEAGAVVTALGLMGAVQSLFHGAARGSGPGLGLGLGRTAFSFTSAAGRCPTCRGSGAERVAMDFMADLELPCADCGGRRFRPEVLAVRWEGLSVADLMETPTAELQERLPAGKLRRGVDALLRLGLGHLALGRAARSLSGGELQRLTLAAHLLGSDGPTLHLLDEPATGLHEADLQRLVGVLRELAARGDLVVMAEHRLSLIAACDHVVDLGPSSGAAGGDLVACGPPGSLEQGATAAALRAR